MKHSPGSGQGVNKAPALPPSITGGGQGEGLYSIPLSGSSPPPPGSVGVSGVVGLSPAPGSSPVPGSSPAPGLSPHRAGEMLSY